MRKKTGTRMNISEVENKVSSWGVVVVLWILCSSTALQVRGVKVVDRTDDSTCPDDLHSTPIENEQTYMGQLISI